MSFMQPQITRDKREWFQVTLTNDEIINIPDLSGLDPSAIDHVEIIEGYGARLSAPGYMDCTEWSVFDTAEAAAQSLIDMYYDMPDEDMTPDELDEYEWLVRITKGLDS